MSISTNNPYNFVIPNINNQQQIKYTSSSPIQYNNVPLQNNIIEKKENKIDNIVLKKMEIKKYFKEKVKQSFNHYQTTLDDLKKNSWERKLLHEICFKYFNTFSLVIGFLTIGITGLSGIFSYLLNVERFESYYTDFKITIVIFTTISTLFQSLLKGFEWDSKSEAHNNSSEHYGQLITDIELFQREIQSYYIEILNYINNYKLYIEKYDETKNDELNDNNSNDNEIINTTPSMKHIIRNEMELREYVNKKFDDINKLYVLKIKEFNKIYSNIFKRNKYIIPSYAEKKKDKIKLDKFIRMMKLNAEMDYIKMRSDNLKKIIDTESYEASTYDKTDVYKFHPPSISWINIEQLLNYKKLSKFERLSKFFKNTFCPCYNEKKKSDTSDINNNDVLNNIIQMKNGDKYYKNDNGNDEKWKTKFQMEKDWVLKTTEIVTRLNKIRESNILENNKNDENNIII